MFDADMVQQLAYRMCFLLQRCAKPVSLPAPTYFAHLAAKRAMELIRYAYTVYNSVGIYMLYAAIYANSRKTLEFRVHPCPAYRVEARYPFFEFCKYSTGSMCKFRYSKLYINNTVHISSSKTCDKVF